MSQDCQATGIQWSYVEHDGMDFTRSEADWQFNYIMNDGICSSVEKLEWNWCNTEGSEFLSGGECEVNETVCETRIHKCHNCNGRY